MARKISIILLVLAAVLVLPVALYDPADKETVLFRQGVPTEQVLEAREDGARPNPLGWLWKPALVCAGLGGVGLFLSRKKR